mgnify:CR=1 FL=1
MVEEHTHAPTGVRFRTFVLMELVTRGKQVRLRKSGTVGQRDMTYTQRLTDEGKQ